MLPRTKAWKSSGTQFNTSITRAYGNAGVPVARTSVGGRGVAKEGPRERTLSSGWREVMGGLLRDVTT